MFDGPREDVNDRFSAQVNRFGAPVSTYTPLGGVTMVWREDERSPALATRVQRRVPNGPVSSVSYDEHGRVVATTDWSTQAADGRYATTLYEWHPRWHAPVRITQPEG